MGARTVAAALTGAVAFTVIETILGMVPGMNEWYAGIFPQLMTPAGLMSMTISTLVTGFFMGLLFTIVQPSIPERGVTKGAVYGIMVWMVAGLMWPVMMSSFAPAPILVLQVGSSFVAYALTGAVLGLLYRPKAAPPAAL